MKLKLGPPPGLRNQACFGMHHSGIFKIIPIGESMLTVPTVLLFVIDYIFHAEKWGDPRYSMNNGVCYYITIIGWIWYILQITLNLLLNILLFQQSASPNVTHLMYYAFFSTATFLPFAVFLWILNFTGVRSIAFIYIYGAVPSLAIYRLGVSYVVYRFAADIDEEVQFKSGYRDLTMAEVGGFENGVSFPGRSFAHTGTGRHSLQEMVPYLRYNREQFEIPLEALDFSEGNILGFGEYGLVYKVWLTRRSAEGIPLRTAVAVKTVDPDFSNVTHFSALLSEAKLMTYLEKHDNVVALIGLVTKEISNRKLYIATELCELGNLGGYLRSVRNAFVDLLSEETGNPKLESLGLEEDKVDTKDLVRWCAQIACGMEFLERQRVIHGDLALRNVLLTESKIAKITDFGLSRRLYSYEVYVKRNKMPLPWRTLAIESLVDMHFSLQSDVWSYGVCCWEIFELGRRAWPQYLEYSLEFVHNVQNGKRMEQPRYCPKEIYTVMLACWKLDYASRPQFRDIIDELGKNKFRL